MRAKKSKKELNYQLLDEYQTNSPLYSSEHKLCSYATPEYADALRCFALELQKLFGMDNIFNRLECVRQQRNKIKRVFRRCFKYCIKGNEDIVFSDLLMRLISGDACYYNFAYGLKLYLLFKTEVDELHSYKELFLSRLERNALSRFYLVHPQRRRLSEAELSKYIYKPLVYKVSRYKMFKKKNAFCKENKKRS